MITALGFLICYSLKEDLQSRFLVAQRVRSDVLVADSFSFVRTVLSGKHSLIYSKIVVDTGAALEIPCSFYYEVGSDCEPDNILHWVWSHGAVAFYSPLFFSFVDKIYKL